VAIAKFRTRFLPAQGDPGWRDVTGLTHSRFKSPGNRATGTGTVVYRLHIVVADVVHIGV